MRWLLSCVVFAWALAVFVLYGAVQNGDGASFWAQVVVAYGGLALVLMMVAAVVVLGLRGARRRLTPEEEGAKPPWSRRRWLTVSALAVLMVLILLAPVWSGFFGPRVTVYVATWRPWRTELTVGATTHETGYPADERLEIEVSFHDHMPGDFQGWRFSFAAVERAHPLLPWVVTGYYSGG